MEHGSATPGWYPHPWRPGFLRYWNGQVWVEGDAGPGWYPHPDDPSSVRYWTGSVWGAPLQTSLPTRPRPERAPRPAWVGWAGVAGVVLIAVAASIVGVLLTRQPSGGPVTASTLPSQTVDASEQSPETTGSAGPTEPTETTRVEGATGVVSEVLGPGSLLLADGRTVELRGVVLPERGACGSKAAAGLVRHLVEGQQVRLRRGGPNLSPDGALLRYVDVDGADVGEALVGAGLAQAEPDHPRSAAYLAAQGQADPLCG